MRNQIIINLLLGSKKYVRKKQFSLIFVFTKPINNKIITIIEFIDFYSEYFPLVKPFICSQKKRKIFKLYLMDTHTKMKLKTHDRGGGDVIPHPMVISL